MATPTKSRNLSLAGTSWALPIATMILVAGSLLFWACVGLFWLLAARPATQQPIVIWMPPAANSSTHDQPLTGQVLPPTAAKDR